MNAPWIDNLFDGGGFSALDEAFARLIGRIDGKPAPELLVAAARVSRARGEGHICIDLAAPGEDVDASGGQGAAIRSDAARRIAAIAASPAVGRPGDRLPLILDGTRLYLFRYWDYERTLVDALRAMTDDDADAPDEARLKACLEIVFPPGCRGGGHPPDWQKVAAFCAARHRFGVDHQGRRQHRRRPQHDHDRRRGRDGTAARYRAVARMHADAGISVQRRTPGA